MFAHPPSGGFGFFTYIGCGASGVMCVSPPALLGRGSLVSRALYFSSWGSYTDGVRLALVVWAWIAYSVVYAFWEKGLAFYRSLHVSVWSGALASLTLFFK